MWVWVCAAFSVDAFCFCIWLSTESHPVGMGAGVSVTWLSTNAGAASCCGQHDSFSIIPHHGTSVQDRVTTGFSLLFHQRSLLLETGGQHSPGMFAWLFESTKDTRLMVQHQ